MDIDPALRGTTFAAALEAAARDEQAKRDKRAMELSNVRPPEPLMYLAGRGYTAPVTTTPDRIIQAKPEKKNDPMTIAGHPDMPLTPTQISILETGMSSDEFVLAPHQRGARPQRLVNAGLIIMAGKGKYSITEKGRERYRLHVAEGEVWSDPTESAINLDDPALQPADNADAKHLKTIEKLNQTIDGLEFQLHIFHKVESAIKPMMEEDGLGQDLLTYVMELRKENDHLTQELRAQWYARIVNPLIDFIDADDLDISGSRGELTEDPTMILRYVTALRQALRDIESQKEYVPFESMQADGLTHLSTQQYVEALRERLAAFKGVDLQSQRMFIAALTAMRDEDGSERPLLDYVADVRKKAQLSEQHLSQIEALRRCVDELQEKLKERVIAPARAVEAMHSLKILQELCGLMPEADLYRIAREAIDRRNAQRS